MKKKIAVLSEHNRYHKSTKFKEQCLFCCCFAFALVGLAVYIYRTGTVVLCFGGTCCILQQFACLLACLLQIKAKQTWATTHHNTTLLL
jgi:hypothetical protein